MCINKFSIGKLKGVHVSSIINEGIRAISTSFFFNKKISHAQKAQKAHIPTKTKKTAFLCA